MPIRIANSLNTPYISGSAPRAIVLHPTIDVVWEFVVYTNVIELCYRNVTYKAPRFSTVVGDVQSPIVAINHKVTIVGMNPPGMMIGVHAIAYSIGRHQLAEVFTPVFGNIDISENRINTVFILWIDTDVRIIERAIADIFFIVDFFPVFTPVGRTIQRILFGFNKRIDNIGFVLCHGQTNAPEGPRGQAFFFCFLLPRFSPVIGKKQATSLTT